MSRTGALVRATGNETVKFVREEDKTKYIKEMEEINPDEYNTLVNYAKNNEYTLQAAATPGATTSDNKTQEQFKQDLAKSKAAAQFLRYYPGYEIKIDRDDHDKLFYQVAFPDPRLKPDQQRWDFYSLKGLEDWINEGFRVGGNTYIEGL